MNTHIELEIPITSEVGAGSVVPFVPQGEVAYIVLPSHMEHLRAHIHGVIARGVSLEDMDIYNGDILIVLKKFTRRDITPDTVCIVYVCATGDLVAKKVIPEANMITLRAANANVSDLHYSPDDIEIRGVVIGFQRMLRGPNPPKRQTPRNGKRKNIREEDCPF